MEHLFHAWLNPGPLVAIESLEAWRELETVVAAADPDDWEVVRQGLAGRTLRTTLFHGDFAPWNIRSINTKNLQAFDWERGDLHGMPGWDWFHFIVQTAILARRHSVERVAAEMEQVLYSKRFKKYAAAAGISDFVKPLFLAALLHQKWIIKPIEGGRVTYELFKLLAARWQMPSRRQLNGDYAVQLVEAAPPGLRAEAALQLKFAVSRLRNLFWEPTLNSPVQPTMAAQLATHGRMVLANSLLLTGVILVHYHVNPHLMFLPFYLIPCALMTWQVDRRWGAVLAVIASVAGPLVQRLNDTDFMPPDIILWNMAMRLMLFLMIVFHADRILQQRRLAVTGERPNAHSRKPADNWAVLLASLAWLTTVVVLQLFSSPHLMFLPLYLIPCATLTLTMGHQWGTVAAVLAAFAGPMVQRFGDPDYEVATVEFWNIIMRYLFFQVFVLMLNQMLRQNILFFPDAPKNRPRPSGKD